MASSSAAEYGIPPRPPTSATALWTHLVRPGAQKTAATQPDISHLAPPAKPLDKNATSMRILLHDAQSHFEKFTIHAGKLLEGFKESRHEIKNVQNLFERDRQSLVGDIIDLVNRAQTELQKAVGSPAQTSAVEDSFKDMAHRLSGLEQRLDSLQAFNQSHTQALQTQIQATQILLDKQGTILSTLAPLLPLLQAIPLHIDALKAHIYANSTSHKPSSLGVARNGPGQQPPNLGIATASKRKRTDIQCPLSADVAPLKRLRTGNSSPSSRQHEHRQTQSSPLVVAMRSQHRSTASHSLASARTISPPSNGLRQANATPRRPLMDLLLPLPVRPDEALRNVDKSTPRRKSGDSATQEATVHASASARTPAENATPQPEISIGVRATPAGGEDPSASAPAHISTNAPISQGARPPRILRVQTSFDANGMKKQAKDRDIPQKRPTNGLSGTPETDIAITRSILEPGSASRLRSAETVRRETGESDGERVFKLPAPNFGRRPTLLASSPSAASTELLSSSSFAHPRGSSAQAHVGARYSQLVKPGTSQIQNEVKMASVQPVLDKPRQTPAREAGRRFIALVDSEDEDEDEEF